MKHTCIPKLTNVSVGNPLRRRAIIVAGGPESDPLWPAIERNARAAYEALTIQGYTNEDLYFMSPVAFSTGHDASSTVSNLQFALDYYKTDTYDLVLYMVGKRGISDISDGYGGNRSRSAVKCMAEFIAGEHPREGDGGLRCLWIRKSCPAADTRFRKRADGYR